MPLLLANSRYVCRKNVKEDCIHSLLKNATRVDRNEWNQPRCHAAELIIILCSLLTLPFYINFHIKSKPFPVARVIYMLSINRNKQSVLGAPFTFTFMQVFLFVFTWWLQYLWAYFCGEEHRGHLLGRQQDQLTPFCGQKWWVRGEILHRKRSVVFRQHPPC